jgi:assimilatory nitrate reductase catalytic subunit
LFRAAAQEAVDEAVVLQIEGVLGLTEASVLHYADKRRGQRRSMRLVKVGASDEARLEGFMLAGDISAEAWIKPLLQDELPAESYGRLLLAPGAKAPMAVASRGKQVCSCFDVSESQINTALQQLVGPPEAVLLALQDQLQCGTNCGSCVPELKRVIQLRAGRG